MKATNVEKSTPAMRVTRATAKKKAVSFADNLSNIRRSLIFTPPQAIADADGGRRSSKRSAAKAVGSMREPSLSEKLRRE